MNNFEDVFFEFRTFFVKAPEFQTKFPRTRIDTFSYIYIYIYIYNIEASIAIRLLKIMAWMETTLNAYINMRQNFS